jgi:hypothetical protein
MLRHEQATAIRVEGEMVDAPLAVGQGYFRDDG